MNSFLRSAGAAIFAALVAGSPANRTLLAQGVVDQKSGAESLGSLLEGVGTTGRVLVIAAHPDDEDTNLIAWLARGRHVETAYLSLTRGDGGQNLIGNELGEALGIIRTQELLAARSIDRGRQYFTRAYDFGFSKNAEETFEHWPRDTVLGDVVKVVRSFRPHVIVAFFSGTPRDGHGHHQVSGILAREAYDLSADTTRFPAATHGQPWTVQKFYRSARQAPESHTLRINAGEYDALLGRSYAELAGESRSQHKSQGFGALQPRGVIWSYLTRETSRVNESTEARSERSIFDGIDTTWTRLKGMTTNPIAVSALDSAMLAMNEARRVYRAQDPTPSVEPLARALRLLRQARSSGARQPLNFTVGVAQMPPVSVQGSGNRSAYAATENIQENLELWDALSTTISRTERALVLAAGIAVEALSPRAVLPVREPVKQNLPDSLLVDIAVFNRGKVPVKVVEAFVPRAGAGARASTTRPANASSPNAVSVELAPDSQVTVKRAAIAFEPTQPWWRMRGRPGDFFATPIDWQDEAERQMRTQVMALARLEVAGVPVDVITPVVNRFADPVKGEQLVPVMAVPGIVVGLDNVIEYIRADVNVQRTFRVNIASSYDTAATVSVSLRLPPGLIADSAQRTRTLTPGEPFTTVEFKLRGKTIPGRHQAGAIAMHDGAAATRGYYEIRYDHIPPQNMYAPSGMFFAGVNVNLPPRARVGYVQGVSDHGVLALRQLDIPVEILRPAMLGSVELSRFTAIVVGPRAYDAQEELPENNRYLLDYVRQGGTLVVQYGQYEMMEPGIMPYEVEITRPHVRVTDENAPVRVLLPNAQQLNWPNRIGPDDWEGWVQERALYMPSKADQRYSALLSMNDPDEPEARGGLLVANVGRGRYVYVTLSLFRQLPSGVPGAARLITNLIAGPRPARAVPSGR